VVADFFKRHHRKQTASAIEHRELFLYGIVDHQFISAGNVVVYATVMAQCQAAADKLSTRISAGSGRVKYLSGDFESCATQSGRLNTPGMTVKRIARQTNRNMCTTSCSAASKRHLTRICSQLNRSPRDHCSSIGLRPFTRPAEIDFRILEDPPQNSPNAVVNSSIRRRKSPGAYAFIALVPRWQSRLAAGGSNRWRVASKVQPLAMHWTAFIGRLAFLTCRSRVAWTLAEGAVE
jgi:hypothetical protein